MKNQWPISNALAENAERGGVSRSLDLRATIMRFSCSLIVRFKEVALKVAIAVLALQTCF